MQFSATAAQRGNAGTRLESRIEEVKEFIHAELRFSGNIKYGFGFKWGYELIKNVIVYYLPSCLLLMILSHGRHGWNHLEYNGIVSHEKRFHYYLWTLREEREGGSPPSS